MPPATKPGGQSIRKKNTRHWSVLFATAIFVLACMFALPVSAKDKEKIVPCTPRKVFDAAVAVVRSTKNYTLISADRQEMVLNFRTSAGMRAVTGYDVNVAFVGQPGGCAEKSTTCSATLVIVRVAKRHAVFTWGGGDALAKTFFDRLDAQLAEK